MPAHGVVTSRPERSLHLAAGVAKAGVFQHYTANSELLAFQGQQVQARDDDVATENLGCDGLAL